MSDATNYNNIPITDFAKACAIFESIHKLIHSKMGARLIRSMADKQAAAMEGGELVLEYQRGYSDGRESGLATWPSYPDEFTVGEILAAVKGATNHATGTPLSKAIEQRDRLAEALDTLMLVVGLTPIMGNKEALQEAMNQARAELDATK